MPSKGAKTAYKKGVRVQATIAPVVSQDIDDLLSTGLFGRSRAEVLQRFIYDGVRAHMHFVRASRRRRLPLPNGESH